MIAVSKSDLKELRRRSNSRTIARRDAQRARIILMHHEGKSKLAISREIGLHRNSVIEWIDRYMEQGLAGLVERPRSGRPVKYSDKEVRRIVEKVCTKPPKGTSRWSVRTLADHLHLDKDKVHRVLQEYDLHPHRLSTFNFSPDPQFRAKLLDVVGLYMKPPDNAIVLCVDEKTGIQALDRTQPLLPLRSGKPKAWTNEYVRHGTRTMLAATDVATGRVTAWVNKTRKTEDFITFMNKVVRRYRNKDLYVVLDNLNTHNGRAATDWLRQHPRVSFHYTPTHASWVNLVECFFSILTRRGLQHAVHRSVRHLEKFLDDFVQQYNKTCGPMIWTKGPEKLHRIIKLTEAFQKNELYTN